MPHLNHVKPICPLRCSANTIHRIISSRPKSPICLHVLCGHGKVVCSEAVVFVSGILAAPSPTTLSQPFQCYLDLVLIQRCVCITLSPPDLVDGPCCWPRTCSVQSARCCSEHGTCGAASDVTDTLKAAAHSS